MTSHAELVDLANELAALREHENLHPRVDGKLAEAEVNLRGVAGVLAYRENPE